MKKQINSIILDGVSCIRGNKIVLRNISVEIPAGSCLSLKGPNGSGKSTFLKMLAGFLKNINGSINILKNNINHSSTSDNLEILWPHASWSWKRLKGGNIDNTKINNKLINKQ